MSWLVWRQFRVQAAVVFGGLAVVAVVLVLTGPHLVSIADGYLKVCRADKNCAMTPNPALTIDGALGNVLNVVAILLPALVGIFWGAPLIARELETGTFRLSWTQSVTRTRWLAVRVGVMGLLSVAATGLFTLMVTWWSSPIDRANLNQFGSTFGLRDIVPIGYAAFAFAVGLTAGVLIRRTVPAMAATLVVFVAARETATFWLRSHLLPPAHLVAPITSPNQIGFSLSSSGLQVVGNAQNIPNAWVLSSDVVNHSGHAPTAQFLKSACRGLLPGGSGGGPGGGGILHRSVAVPGGGPPAVFRDCAAKLSARFHEVITYQPANRYWALQGLETAIFIVVGLVLVGLCFWWVRHRLS
jgi:hypothetical protein